MRTKFRKQLAQQIVMWYHNFGGEIFQTGGINVGESFAFFCC